MDGMSSYDWIFHQGIVSASWIMFAIFMLQMLKTSEMTFMPQGDINV